MGQLHVRGRADAWLPPGRAVLDVHVSASDPHRPCGAVRLVSAGAHEAGEARAVRIAAEPVQVTVVVEMAFDLRS